MEQSHEAANHVAFTLRKHRGMNAAAKLLLFLLLSPAHGMLPFMFSLGP